MGKNVIVQEQTVRDLLEAYASLSAWYYQLWSALRSVNGTAEPPGDAARAAFVQRLIQDFPELSAVARTITVPRQFVPPPPAVAVPGAVPAPGAAPAGSEEPTTVVEPAPARLRAMSEPPPANPAPTPAGVAPPPFVAPGSVKYNP